jgi:GxxExxY protein
MTENEISYTIRGAIFKVFNTLGPGLLESAYEAVLMFELQKEGLNVKCQVPLPLIYDEIRLDVDTELICW